MTRATVAGVGHSSSPLARTGALVRLALRRDRILLPLWIGVVALLAVAVGSIFIGSYSTPEEIHTLVVETASSPATIALLGSVYAENVGALVAWRWTIQGTIVLGLVNLFVVVRHTRAEEEAGRSELIGATAVGRFAPLTAAFIVMTGADLALALIVAALLTMMGLPAAGSLALGLSVAGASWVVAAAAGTAAQLSEHAGTARGIAAGVFGLFFALRAFGDVAGARDQLAWLSWLSPLGWARLTRPFAHERWALFGLFVLAGGLFIALAYTLAARRDFGEGVLPPRLGPAAARPWLRSPLGLAWRLHRGALWGWTAGAAVIGLLFGALATTVSAMLSANPAMTAFLDQLGGGASPGETIFTLYFVAFGPVVAIYAISAVLRLRSEEASGRVEPLLAAPISRTQWMTSHLLVAAIGQVVVLATLGLTSGFAYGLSGGDVLHEALRVLGAALAYLPAAWLLGAIAAALFGLASRFATGAWGVLVAVGFLELFWELGQISQALYNLSPFAHVPRILIGERPDWTTTALLAIAAALAAFGLLAFRHRDLRSGD